MPSRPKATRPSYLPEAPKKPLSPHYALYNSKRWRRYSRRFRTTCAVCDAEGRTVAAAVVDHVVPLSQGGAVWDERNHMGMCHRHHNSKRGYEKRGYCVATQEAADGLCPLDGAEILDKLTGVSKALLRGPEWIESTHPRPGGDPHPPSEVHVFGLRTSQP